MNAYRLFVVVVILVLVLCANIVGISLKAAATFAHMVFVERISFEAALCEIPEYSDQLAREVLGVSFPESKAIQRIVYDTYCQ